MIASRTSLCRCCYLLEELSTWLQWPTQPPAWCGRAWRRRCWPSKGRWLQCTCEETQTRWSNKLSKTRRGGSEGQRFESLEKVCRSHSCLMRPCLDFYLYFVQQHSLLIKLWWNKAIDISHPWLPSFPIPWKPRFSQSKSQLNLHLS